MAKVFVGLPVMGGYFPQMVGSLIKWLQANPGGHDLHFVTLHQESLISRGRNQLASACLESDCDYLLMIDADLAFPVDALDRLIQRDKDVIAAPYTTKGTPSLWTTRFLDDLMPPFVQGAMPVRFVSGGFTLIKRSVLEALAKVAPRYRQRDAWYYDFFSPYVQELVEGAPEYLPEDWAFCQRVRDQGFDIWCDFDIRLTHWGMQGYSMVEINQQLPSNPMLPFMDEVDSMAATVASLTAPDQNGAAATGDFAALLGDMMNSFQEVQGMLNDMASRKLTASGEPESPPKP